jgi:tetratricopeptide (TPR) repeat protein
MSEPAALQNLSEQALSSYNSGDYQKAAALFTSVAEGFTKNGDNLSAAEALNNRSVALLKAGCAEEALQAAMGTDRVFASGGDSRRQAQALANQAAALEALKKNAEALNTYRQSAELLEQIGDKESLTFVMQSMSALQLRMGKQFDAMASMDAALASKKNLTLKEKLLKKLLRMPFKMLR